jgi:hypothetical protein
MAKKKIKTREDIDDHIEKVAKGSKMLSIEEIFQPAAAKVIRVLIQTSEPEKVHRALGHIIELCKGLPDKGIQATDMFMAMVFHMSRLTSDVVTAMSNEDDVKQMIEVLSNEDDQETLEETPRVGRIPKSRPN